MLTPTPYLDWNKDVSPSIRAERNRSWDESSMSPVPLTQPGSGRVTGGSYDISWDPNEIQNIPNRAVLTATFVGYRSVLTPSERSLYSEITLRVEEVFQDRTVSGHPVALHDGQVFSIKNPMARPNLFIQPGHKYLFVAGYEAAGDFYRYADSWDISDGTVRASSPRALYFVQEGRSSLNSLSVGQLSQALSKELYGKAPDVNPRGKM